MKDEQPDLSTNQTDPATDDTWTPRQIAEAIRSYKPTTAQRQSKTWRAVLAAQVLNDALNTTTILRAAVYEAIMWVLRENPALHGAVVAAFPMRETDDKGEEYQRHLLDQIIIDAAHALALSYEVVENGERYTEWSMLAQIKELREERGDE